MPEQEKKAKAPTVRLRAGEQAGTPKFANYSQVGVANNIAYVDFGFVEPASVAQAARNQGTEKEKPRALEGTAVTRVAMGLRELQQLHHQIDRIMTTLKSTQKKNN
jgi:hypothetical protein